MAGDAFCPSKTKFSPSLMMSFIPCNVGGGNYAFYLCGIKDSPLINDCFFLIVLAVYSLHGILVLTWDILFFPDCACLASSISSGDSLFLCVPAVYGVFMFLCIFLFYFLRCIHTVTLHGVASRQVSMFFLWRGRKSPLPRISIFWPRELCPEELYTDGRHLVCLLCC